MGLPYLNLHVSIFINIFSGMDSQAQVQVMGTYKIATDGPMDTTTGTGTHTGTGTNSGIVTGTGSAERRNFSTLSLFREQNELTP
jgi:hypothetical protein